MSEVSREHDPQQGRTRTVMGVDTVAPRPPT